MLFCLGFPPSHSCAIVWQLICMQPSNLEKGLCMNLFLKHQEIYFSLMCALTWHLGLSKFSNSQTRNQIYIQNGFMTVVYIFTLMHIPQMTRIIELNLLIFWNQIHKNSLGSFFARHAAKMVSDLQTRAVPVVEIISIVYPHVQVVAKSKDTWQMTSINFVLKDDDHLIVFNNSSCVKITVFEKIDAKVVFLISITHFEQLLNKQI